MIEQRSDCVIVDERQQIVEGLGIEYVYIPVDFAAPTAEDFARFSSAMDAARGRKVWAHCAANYRVSAFVSIYGRQHLGWSAEQAQSPTASTTRMLASSKRDPMNEATA